MGNDGSVIRVINLLFISNARKSLGDTLTVVKSDVTIVSRAPTVSNKRKISDGNSLC